jgi:hypothetical protein
MYILKVPVSEVADFSVGDMGILRKGKGQVLDNTTACYTYI